MPLLRLRARGPAALWEMRESIANLQKSSELTKAEKVPDDKWDRFSPIALLPGESFRTYGSISIYYYGNS